MMGLTIEAIDLCLESLKYTKQQFERYSYPTPDVRAARLQSVENAADQLRATKQALKKEQAAK